jgi:hypothetical protein
MGRGGGATERPSTFVDVVFRYGMLSKVALLSGMMADLIENQEYR